VEERLEDELRGELVRWGELDLECVLTEDELRIRDVVQPAIVSFLALDYVERIRAKGLQGDRDQGTRLPLQIVVLYDQGERDPDESSELLAVLDRVLKGLLPAGQAVQRILIVLGSSKPNLAQDTAYWPRFLLDTRTNTGLGVTRERMIGVCGNLLVTLLTSALVSAIDHRVGVDREHVGWIWAGAAAVVADLPNMMEFVQASLFQRLIHPVLQLDPRARNEVTAFVSERVWTYQRNCLRTALSIPGESNRGSGEPLACFVWGGGLKDSSSLEVTRMDLLMADGIFPPSANLRQDLYSWYAALRTALISRLGATAGEEFRTLCQSFAFRLDPMPGETAKGGPGYSSARGEECSLRGLAAVHHALERAAEGMVATPELVYPQFVSPALATDSYLGATAELDASDIEGEYRRYRRRARAMLTFRGYVMRLIPALPILAAVIAVVSGWGLSQTLALAASTAALILFGAACYFIQHRKLSALRDEVVGSMHMVLRHSTLGLIAVALKGFKVLAAWRLRKMAFSCGELLAALKDASDSSVFQIARTRSRANPSRQGPTSVFWLADWDKCETFVNEAAGRAAAFQGGFYSNVAGSIELLQGEQGWAQSGTGTRIKSHRPVLDDIHLAVKKLAMDAFRDSEVTLGSLVRSQDALKAGKQWRWLYERAEPLGGAGLAHQFVAFAVANPAAYDTDSSATSASDAPWINERLVVKSRQQHEITCIRGVIELEGGDHGLG
jgi:hypothetical protein